MCSSCCNRQQRATDPFEHSAVHPTRPPRSCVAPEIVSKNRKIFSHKFSPVSINDCLTNSAFLLLSLPAQRCSFDQLRRNSLRSSSGGGGRERSKPGECAPLTLSEEAPDCIRGAGYNRKRNRYPPASGQRDSVRYHRQKNGNSWLSSTYAPCSREIKDRMSPIDWRICALASKKLSLQHYFTNDINRIRQPRSSELLFLDGRFGSKHQHDHASSNFISAMSASFILPVRFLIPNKAI